MELKYFESIYVKSCIKRLKLDLTIINNKINSLITIDRLYVHEYLGTSIIVIFLILKIVY